MPVTINGNGVVTGLDSEGSSDLNTKLEAAGGLVMVTPTTIANTGGTATLTNGAVTYSGVTNVSLNGCFSSTYENYMVVFRIVLAGGADCGFRYRVAGVDATASNYVEQFSRTLNTTYLGVLRTQTFNTLSLTGGTNAVYEGKIFFPFLTRETQFIFNQGTEAGIAFMTGRHSIAASYDGLTLFTASGTFTGDIRVYGLRNGI